MTAQWLFQWLGVAAAGFLPPSWRKRQKAVSLKEGVPVSLLWKKSDSTPQLSLSPIMTMPSL